jgi:hypothetical protein
LLGNKGMSLSSIASITTHTPGTDPLVLKAAEVNLVKTGDTNEASLAATLSRPLPSDLKPHGTGINISASV